MFAILTGHTCGEACWHAVEDICRCSCGGANHGCLRGADGIRPARTCRVKGHRYELHATGKRSELWDEFADLMRAAPPRIIMGRSYPWNEYSQADSGAPYLMKAASADQCDKWEELRAYAGMDRVQRYHAAPYLIWRKIG